MGTDIHGFIEVHENGHWTAKGDVDLDRNYVLFGCLFGVRNRGNFRPLFPNRGLPEGISQETQALQKYCHSHSWASYAELAAIDPEEEALALDDWVYVFEVQPDGTEALVLEMAFDEKKGMPKLLPVSVKNPIFRRIRLKRKDALARAGYPRLFEQLSELAKKYGRENVRIVVFFDS